MRLKKSIIVFVALSFACSCFALEFRNTSWLMTKNQVIASESGRELSELSVDGQQRIVFGSVVNGFTAEITYILENDRLLSASYNFKKDASRAAFDAMKRELTKSNGAPSFDKGNIIGWRLEKTEIALAHLPDGTTYAAYWEKSYFARINDLTETKSVARK